MKTYFSILMFIQNEQYVEFDMMKTKNEQTKEEILKHVCHIQKANIGGKIEKKRKIQIHYSEETYFFPSIAKNVVLKYNIGQSIAKIQIAWKLVQKETLNKDIKIIIGAKLTG